MPIRPSLLKAISSQFFCWTIIVIYYVLCTLVCYKTSVHFILLYHTVTHKGKIWGLWKGGRCLSGILWWGRNDIVFPGTALSSDSLNITTHYFSE